MQNSLSLIAGIYFAIRFRFGGHWTWFHFIWKGSFGEVTSLTRLFRPSNFNGFFLLFFITVKCLFNWNFISEQSLEEKFRVFALLLLLFYLTDWCVYVFFPLFSLFCFFFPLFFLSLSFVFFRSCSFLRIFCFRSRWHCWRRYQRMFSEQ